jgi:glycosyltransferase involved in cell wall biosynthesis
MALLEAMAHGVVPITTDDGMISDVVTDGENGYLIEKHSPKQVISALHRALVQKSDARLKALSYEAHLRVRENHSMRTYGAVLEEIYAEVG